MVQWDNVVVRYPQGIATEPNGFHDGPDTFHVQRAGWYRWERTDWPGCGPWSLVGPYRSRAAAVRREEPGRCAPFHKL